jgi:glycosyltransferase involved in cell wall biosynthesis
MIDLAYSIADQNVATTKSMGIYNFSLSLARHLARHPLLGKLDVFSNHTTTPDLQLSANSRIEECGEAVRSKFGRILWDQWGVHRRARAAGRSWLFLPKGFCSFLQRPPVPVAAYVHDIMGVFYQRRYPRYGSRFESWYFDRSLKATVTQARIIFTNTEFTKNELTHWTRQLGLTPPEIMVAGYGFEVPEAGEAEKTDRVLLFASDMPHKRTDTLVSFLNQWLRESNYRGVIDCIGIFSNGRAKCEGPNWNWIGRVPPAQSRQMIRRAKAVIYSSEYEGFGMPPVEAVLEGTCPVYSDIPPMREVMGNAGRPFSNDSGESFRRAMDEAFSTSPETIEAWSRELVKRHHWHGVTDKIVHELSRLRFDE